MPERRASRSRIDPAVAAAATSAAPDLKVYGGSARALDVIASSAMSLVCGLGTVGENHQVLVPYIEFSLLEPDEDSPDAEGGVELEEAYDATLTFENAAFLIMDIARDFKAATHNLGRFAEGPLQPETKRLAYATECLRRARNHIDETVAALEALAERSPTPTPDVKPKARTRAKPAVAPEGKGGRVLRTRTPKA